MSLSFVVEDKDSSKKKKQRSTTTNTCDVNKQQRKKQRRFSQQEHMDSNLKEGLNKPIEASNKGFKLLEKFGFKKEEGGLGKFGTGMQEPIAVKPQLGRPTKLGIGKEKSLLAVQTRIQEELIKHQQNLALLETHFRHSVKYIQECKHLKRDVIQAEKVIEQLDEKEDIERHDLWPPVEKEDESANDSEEEEEEGEDTTDAKIRTLEAPERLGDCSHETDEYPQWLHKLELRLVVSRATYMYGRVYLRLYLFTCLSTYISVFLHVHLNVQCPWLSISICLCLYMYVASMSMFMSISMSMCKVESHGDVSCAILYVCVVFATSRRNITVLAHDACVLPLLRLWVHGCRRAGCSMRGAASAGPLTTTMK